MKKERFDCLKLDLQLCFPLYAAARRVTALYTPYFREYGLTYTQYLVFLVLWEEQEATVGRLCERLFLDSGTVTPLIKKMEKQGYIERRRSSEDERVVIVSLTEKGMELKKAAADIPGRVGSCIPLSAQEAGELYDLLYKLLDRLEEKS